MNKDTYHIYNVIKKSICRYINTPLKCKKEDIENLSIEIQLLLNNDNYNYNTWYQIFNKYLINLQSGELENLISYVKNHI